MHVLSLGPYILAHEKNFVAIKQNLIWIKGLESCPMSSLSQMERATYYINVSNENEVYVFDGKLSQM